jgi:enoyl-CoA hydratase
MPIVIDALEPGLARVMVSNPTRRNALGPDEFFGLAQAWDRLEADRSLRCVVVTGEGDQAFCSGAQLDADFSAVADVDEMVDRALLKTRLFSKPLVAAVNGHAVAGGLELMLACDLRVASASARLGLPEVHWGIVPSGGAAMKLIDQIGQAPALQLLLTGELVSADQALAMGLVNRVVAPGEVMAAALALARTVAANSPVAVAHTKRLAYGSRPRQWAAQEPEERRSAQAVRHSPDMAVGRAAFLGKKPPRYGDA